MNINARILLLPTIIIALTACGGGGGGGTASTAPAAPITLSGRVIDGYITGAIVCLDVNSNNTCDSGEPTTTSGVDGAYTLPAYTGNIAGMRVIAEVGADAVDKDTGRIGEGNTYSLLAPAAASSTVTPLSTLVSSAIAAGGGESLVSIGEALSNVSVSTGIPVDKLLANDFKATGDTKTALVAQVTATAIAQVTNALRANPDVKVALTDGQIIQQAVVQVQQKVLKQVISDGQVTTATGTSTASITTAVTAAVTSVNLSGQIQNIIAATQSGAGAVLSMADLFKAGFVAAESRSGDYINSSGYRYDGPNWRPSDPKRMYWQGYKGLSAEYLQFDVNSDVEPPMIRYVLGNNNKWYLPYENGEDWTFDGSAWVLETDIGNTNGQSVKPTFDQNCIIVPKNAKGTVTQRYCAAEKKLDGQLMTKYIPSMCDRSSGSAIASTCTTATFPPGSSGYDLTATTISTLSGAYNGLFQLWTNTDGSWDGYCTKQWDGVNQKCTSSSGTISDFIKWTQFPNLQSTGNSCNVPFNVKSYDDKSKKGVMNWGSNPTLGCSGNFQFASSDVLETSNFEVITLAGKEILIVPTPAIYYANNPSSDKPYMIFAVQKSSTGVTGVWNGEFYPTNFKQSIPFTGDPATNTQILSSTMFDAILKQQGITTYPYKGKSSSGKYNGMTSTDPN